MKTQYKTVYPATIDTLLAGMQKKNFTYMVIADPIEEADVDAMLYQVRDFGGQAESLKSFNYSENKSSSVSIALSKSKSICDGTSESKQEKSKWGMVVSTFIINSKPSISLSRPIEHIIINIKLMIFSLFFIVFI